VVLHLFSLDGLGGCGGSGGGAGGAGGGGVGCFSGVGNLTTTVLGVCSSNGCVRKYTGLKSIETDGFRPKTQIQSTTLK
jgi:hypothetical protein